MYTRGGAGQSIETAIVLTGKTPHVVSQEYGIFLALYGFRPEKQGFVKKVGLYYDMLSGDGITLYFDIPAYWQHEYGG